jgi:hypothetical protein
VRLRSAACAQLLEVRGLGHLRDPGRLPGLVDLDSQVRDLLQAFLATSHFAGHPLEDAREPDRMR